MKIRLLIGLVLASFVTLACKPIDVADIAGDLEQQRSAFQNAQFECPSLSISLKLAIVFQQLGESHNAYNVMQDARNDEVKNDNDRLKWLITNTEIALSKKDTCAANKSLNELALFKNFQNGGSQHQKLRAKLYQSIQNTTLDSQTIACALTVSRSITVQSPATRGMRVVAKLDIAIHFDTDSARLTPQGKTQAQKLAQALCTGSLQDNKLTLVGHTDITGEAPYNKDLSQRRAQAVKAYLAHINGSLTNQIETLGKGEYDLLTTGTSPQDHQLNRRVEIQLN
ncbi:MAG: OmpA family protein [Alcanivoracaceae bacterium]|nr:OmpA family protein [Alcanivoracaceae bacterium]